jgi:hypothetical protein
MRWRTGSQWKNLRYGVMKMMFVTPVSRKTEQGSSKRRSFIIKLSIYLSAKHPVGLVVACWHTDFSWDAELQVFKIRPINFGAMENRQLPTYPVVRAGWQTFFLQFFSISQFRVNEHCKQIRSIHRELKSEFDLFIEFAKRVVKTFKYIHKKWHCQLAPSPLPVRLHIKSRKKSKTTTVSMKLTLIDSREWKTE